jgi:hypothetical protein
MGLVFHMSIRMLLVEIFDGMDLERGFLHYLKPVIGMIFKSNLVILWEGVNVSPTPCHDLLISLIPEHGRYYVFRW